MPFRPWRNSHSATEGWLREVWSDLGGLWKWFWGFSRWIDAKRHHPINFEIARSVLSYSLNYFPPHEWRTNKWVICVRHISKILVKSGQLWRFSESQWCVSNRGVLAGPQEDPGFSCSRQLCPPCPARGLETGQALQWIQVFPRRSREELHHSSHTYVWGFARPFEQPHWCDVLHQGQG